MRDLHDDIERRFMLDLTGQDRPVPPIGRGTSAAESAPDRLAPSQAAISGQPAQVHAGAAEAIHGASDAEYRDQLRGLAVNNVDTLSGRDLDTVGWAVGLPRARLVQTQQGEPS